MISYSERKTIVALVTEAENNGARKWRACEEIDISLRTLQRWTENETIKADQRPEAIRSEPANKLTPQEREKILDVCNKVEYAHLPPSQIVPKLADKGEYLASESTFYRLLKEANQLTHRGRTKTKQKRAKPKTYIAEAPNQVWSWDISYLPSTVRGRFFYLYLILDIFSRKIVGWEVHEHEGGEEAAELIQRTVLAEQCFKKPLVLHSDNGSPMKSQTMLSKLYELGIEPSRSRPRVSNDNAYSESLFRTLKYCPMWPSSGFDSQEDARQWVNDFSDGYNELHQHSALRFVTPAARHRGEDTELLTKRKQVYELAREKKPERWSGNTRNWNPIGSVALNPEDSEQEI